MVCWTEFLIVSVDWGLSAYAQLMSIFEMRTFPLILSAFAPAPTAWRSSADLLGIDSSRRDYSSLLDCSAMTSATSAKGQLPTSWLLDSSLSKLIMSQRRWCFGFSSMIASKTFLLTSAAADGWPCVELEANYEL